jgi:hypothetical protein
LAKQIQNGKNIVFFFCWGADFSVAKILYSLNFKIARLAKDI